MTFLVLTNILIILAQEHRALDPSTSLNEDVIILVNFSWMITSELVEELEREKFLLDEDKNLKRQVGSGIGIPEPASCGKSNSRTNKIIFRQAHPQGARDIFKITPYGGGGGPPLKMKSIR